MIGNLRARLAALSTILALTCAAQTYENDAAQLADRNLKAPHSMESEHFRIVWGRGLSKDFTVEQAKGTLRNFEDCRELFIRKLGMKAPGERDGKFYRLTVATMDGGYQTGGSVVNIDPSGLRVDPPSWVIPHELMHSFQEAQGGHMIGDWCESHANYATERMILNHQRDFAGQSEFDPAFTTMAHWYLAHGRDYYLCWPIWFYLDENPDRLPGLGSNFVAKMWQQAEEEEEFFHIVKRLAPAVNIQNLIGLYARRAATWDYPNGAAMRKKCDEFFGDETVRRFIYPELIARPDEPSWWRVPPELAPQQGGYTIHRLVPIARKVTVDFRGLPDRVRGADWRVSFVVKESDGSARYGKMWNAGEESIALAPDEMNLFLVVAATPTNFVFGSQDEMRFPWNSHPQRQRFPYEIKLRGAKFVPPILGDRDVAAPGHRHPNGGGLVEDSAKVSPTAFVGTNAMVLGEAQVTDNARVEDFAIVKDRAQVRNRAIVSGRAMILDSAIVRDDARVRDWAVVRDEAIVSGHARILQRATAKEKARVKEFATVEGCADIWADGKCFAGGDAVLCADYGGGRRVTNGFQFGFVPYDACPQSWIDSRTAPHRRYVSYDFDKPHDSLAKDAPGITDGILLGAPKWHETDGKRDGFLEFNGKSQAILLERSCCDFQAATFSAWIKWRGSTSRQPLFYFGTDPDAFLAVTLDGQSGRASIAAQMFGKKFAIISQQAVPQDRWTHVAAALDGSNATLFVDGKIAAHGPFATKPEEFLAPVDGRSVDHDYFGRDDDGNYFAGCADEIRMFSKAIEAGRIEAGITRRSTLRGPFCAGQRTSNFQSLEKPATETSNDWNAGTPYAGLSRLKELREVKIRHLSVNCVHVSP